MILSTHGYSATTPLLKAATIKSTSFRKAQLFSVKTAKIASAHKEAKLLFMAMQDVIKDYRSEDSIYTDIASSASTVGNDILISLGTGSIKLLGAAGIRPRIITMSSNYEERSIMDYDLEEIMLPTTDYNVGEVDTSNALKKSLSEFTVTSKTDK